MQAAAPSCCGRQHRLAMGRASNTLGITLQQQRLFSESRRRRRCQLLLISCSVAPHAKFVGSFITKDYPVQLECLVPPGRAGDTGAQAHVLHHGCPNGVDPQPLSPVAPLQRWLWGRSPMADVPAWGGMSQGRECGPG